MARALGQDAVQGNAFTGRQLHQVARLQVGHRDPHRAPVAQGGRVIGRQCQQGADRGAGLALGTRLQPAAGQDQGHDHRRGLEPHLAGCGGDQSGGQRDDSGKDECRACAKRHQAVHLGRAAAQGGQPGAEKAPPRPGQHRQRQDHLHHPQRADRHQPVQPVVEGGDQVAAHLDHHHRQGQGGGGQRGAAQGGRLVRGRGGAVDDDGRGIAQIGHDPCQRVRGQGGVVGHLRAMRGQVHLRLRHVGARGQNAAHAARTGRTAHPADGQPGHGQGGREGGGLGHG